MEKPECGRSLLAPEAVPRNRFDHVYLCIKMNHHHALQKAIYPIMQKHIANQHNHPSPITLISSS